MSHTQNRLVDIAQAVLTHPNSIFSIIDNGTKVYSLAGKASALKELAEFADRLQTHSPRQIHNIFNSMPENCKNLLSKEAQEVLNNQGFFTWLNDQQKENIASEIEQCQSKLVNSILYKELFCASTLIITQVSSLVKLAKELKEASNLVEESKDKIDRIIEKLDELETDQTKMSQTVAAMEETEEVNPAALEQLALDVMFLSNRESDVRRSIDQVRVDVSGKIVRLGDQRTGAIRDACVDVSQVAGNLIEYSMAGDMYSGGLKILKVLTTSFFVAMSVAKYQQSQLTAERIEELSVILKQVEALEKDVEEMQKIILKAMTWLKERREAAAAAAQRAVQQ